MTRACKQPATSCKAIKGALGAGVAGGCSTTAKRAIAWLSVSSVVRLGKCALR